MFQIFYWYPDPIINDKYTSIKYLSYMPLMFD
ncbi:hypothetical protein Pla144_19400 [Bythopirellula polymerisocia]|uniref:Uncharacterized protein n=1 Tax=Bythopirellula polymerisocia TaxID=2528003 RepID=A0A5C6CW74_9BACT|nr:hypothetical protein Pla144_19400 [Bythopirellula polymerisocia]